MKPISKLTPKQTVKVNAGLAVIYKTGGKANVDAVNAVVRENLDEGDTPAKAYSLAFNWLAMKDPTVGAILARVTKVIEASDDATVSQYGAALDHFVATGDEGQIDALAPMMTEDMVALDSREEAGEAPSALSDSPAPIRQQFLAPTPEEAPVASSVTTPGGGIPVYSGQGGCGPRQLSFSRGETCVGQWCRVLQRAKDGRGPRSTGWPADGVRRFPRSLGSPYSASNGSGTIPAPDRSTRCTAPQD